MKSTEQRMVILLVEDSADDVFFFQRAIKKCELNLTVHLASDGLEAMDYLLHKGCFSDATSYPVPDIMFLDLKLPHVNGFEVLEWMQRHAECPRVPVVVLTSSSQPEDQVRAESLGAALFLTKPPSPDHLREAIQKYVSGKEESVGGGLAPKFDPSFKGNR